MKIDQWTQFVSSIAGDSAPKPSFAVASKASFAVAIPHKSLNSRNQRASSSPRRISPTSAPAMHREALVTRRSTRLPAALTRGAVIRFLTGGTVLSRTNDLVLVSKMNRGRRDLMKRW